MTAGVAVAVAALGGTGAVARVVVDRAVTARAGAAFPYGILVVNLSGALLLGILFAAGLGHDAYLVFGGGLCGGYTTFSTWMAQTAGLSRRAAAINVAGSLVLGVAAAALGRQL